MVLSSLSADFSHRFFCLMLELLRLFRVQGRDSPLQSLLEVLNLAFKCHVGSCELICFVMCPHRDRSKLLICCLKSKFIVFKLFYLQLQALYFLIFLGYDFILFSDLLTLEKDLFLANISKFLG